MSNDKILATYRNSTPVIRINKYPMKIEDIVFATLISNSNLLLVSESGEGKTQIAYDVLYGVFGGEGNYIRVSPDMELKDVYTAINLEKLKEAKNAEEIIEITRQARIPFTAIDELNRAPPIVQNQLLNILDGYIEVKGKRYPLGVDIGDENYHAGIATVNLGDHRYGGTFNVDRAIRDRFHIIVDLDNFTPTTSDLVEISLVKTQKLSVTEKKNRFEEIIKHYREVKERENSFESLVVALYLKKGVDYLSAEPYSQMKTKGILPEGVHEGGGLQNVVYPISTRTLKKITNLEKALTYVAELKGYQTTDDLRGENVFEILKLVLPYSGSLKEGIVMSRYYGNEYLATLDCVKILREKIDEIKQPLAIAMKKKRQGKVSEKDLQNFDGEWEFIKELIER